MSDDHIEKHLRSYHALSPAERGFIADMRRAAAVGVGYGFMQQVTEWEWQGEGIAAWGPEYFEAERKKLTADIERLRTAMVRAQKETGTSTSTWHVLEDALRETTKGAPLEPSPAFEQLQKCGKCGAIFVGSVLCVRGGQCVPDMRSDKDQRERGEPKSGRTQ
jgi:hypothetical protein